MLNETDRIGLAVKMHDEQVGKRSRRYLVKRVITSGGILRCLDIAFNLVNGCLYVIDAASSKLPHRACDGNQLHPMAFTQRYLRLIA